MLKTNSHSVWLPTGFLIQATKTPGLFRFADLNPEVSFKQVLTRTERLKIGMWFLLQAIWKD